MTTKLTKGAALDLEPVNGRYRILGELGSGGQAVVFKVADLFQAGRVKVLKALPAQANREQAERLRWEFVRLARLDHPRLLRVFDLDVADGSGPLTKGQLFFTAEFSAGQHPAALLERLGKRRRVELLWRIATDVTSALDHIHGRGLLHGDVKPENMLCTAHGDVKLIDLGLSTVAASLRPDEINGTLIHLAPEGFAGAADERTDLYALGSTLYLLASGVPPRGGDEDQPISDRVRALLQRDPEPLKRLAAHLPRGLCDLVDALLAREPDSRPRSARVALEMIARSRRSVSLSLAGSEEGLPLLAPGFVGREDVLEDVLAVLSSRLRDDPSPNGGPAVVLLRGAPGIGRSTVINEAVRRLQLLVATGEISSPRISRGISLSRACRPLLPGVSAVLTDDSAMTELVTGLEELSRESPLLLIVEDGDDDTSALRRLFALMARDSRLALGRVSLLVRLTAGADLHSGGLALERELAPFTTEEVASLVGRCLGSSPPSHFVEHLDSCCFGLPGLLMELLRSAWAAAGDRRKVADLDVDHLRGQGLVEVAAARLKNLSPLERRLAIGLALAGEEIPLHWTTRLADWGPGQDLDSSTHRTTDLAGSPLEACEALEVLERQGLATIRRGRARLAHPMYGEALAPSPREREELHRRLAELFGELADKGDEGARASQVLHLAEAGSSLELPRLAQRAAEASGRKGRWGEAATLLRIARAALPGPEGHPIALDLARALVQSGSYDDALLELDRLGDDLSAAERLQVATLRGLAHQRRGDLREARHLLVQALSEPAAKPPDQVLEAKAVLGRVYIGLGELQAASDLLSTTPAHRELQGASNLASTALGGREAQDPISLLEVSGLVSYYTGDLRTAQEIFDRAAARASGEDPARQARALGYAGMVHQTAGRLSAAAACYQDASRLATEQHDLHSAALYEGNLGAVLREQGRPAEALAPTISSVRRMIQLGRTAELPSALFNLGNLQLALGDVDGACRELAVMAQEADRVGAPLVLGYVLLLGSDLLRQVSQQGRRPPGQLPPTVEGRSPTALAREAAKVFGEVGASREQAYALIAELECWAVEGRPEQAGGALTQLAELAQELEDPLVTHLASLARGRLGLAGARELQADRDLAAARRFFDEGHSEQAWRTEVVRAGLALTRGDTAETSRLLASATHLEVAQRQSLPEAYRPLRDRDPDLLRLAQIRQQLSGSPPPSAGLLSSEGEQGRVNDAVQLRRLLSINQRINSERRLPLLLELVLDAVLELTDAERGFILLLSGDDELEIRVARNMDRRNLVEGELALSQSIAEEAAREGRAIITVDAAMDARFSDAVSVHGLRLRSVLAVPLRVKGKVVGTVYADNRLRMGAFTEADLALVRDFAQQAAIAIENARLHEELQARQAEIERLNRKLARKVALQEAEIADMRTELRQNQAALQVRYDYSNIVGASPQMAELFHLLDRITDVDLPVVIHGESGTGKELVARAIHVNGPRKDRPFVSENCGAVPETLLESILFGHVKGAFTGAHRDRRGLFEVAHGGTLFLDEVGEMSPAMQTRLLRVLQNGELRPVGGDRTITVDVRIIAASNQSLTELVERGAFRQDLYYRLNVLQVTLPPLRDRAQDIPLLVDHFIGKHSPDRPRRVGRAAMTRLLSYPWPGNVRELENEIRRALALGDDLLGLEDLSKAVLDAGSHAGPEEVQDTLHLRSQVEALERNLLAKALERTGNNQTRAAALLGLSRFGLLKKLRRYEMLVGSRKAG